jgi:DNA-binding XRE family transcriptional regulator
MTRERYNPVNLDVGAMRKRWSRDPAFAKTYEALADEFATLAELVRARQQADMTQADVADRMGIAQASVARLESSAGSRKHAPSIATLRRYADAVGCDLRISLSPKAGRKRSSSRATATG